MSADELVAARLAALAALDGALDGTIANGGALKRAWPAKGTGDPFLRRAFHEGLHLVVTRGELERRIVLLVRRLLEEGGTLTAFDEAYDALVREHADGQ